MDLLKLLHARPELQAKFAEHESHLEFIDDPDYFDLEQRGWEVITEFDGDHKATKVIDGRTWVVQTVAWTSTFVVLCDGLATQEPEFEFPFYAAFEIVDLGLWPLPDFEFHLRTAIQALTYFDIETAGRPARRLELESRIATLRGLIR